MMETDAAISLEPSAMASPARAMLRGKIGWLRQLVRGLAVVWALWALDYVVAVWGDRAQIV